MATSTPPPVPQRSPKKWVIWLVLGVCTPFVIAFVFFVNYRISNASAVKRLEARVKAKGEPLTLKDLAAANPPIPDAENGAMALIEVWFGDDPVFWDAFRSREYPLPEPDKSEAEQPLSVSRSLLESIRLSKSAPIAEKDLVEAEKYLVTKKQHIEAVRAALRYPRFQFPVQITNGYEANLAHLTPVRDEAENFRIAALVAINRSDVEAAIGELEDTARTADVLTNEVFLVGHLTRAGIHQKVLETMERLLSRMALSINQLERVEKLLARMQMQGALRTSFIGERVTMQSLFDLSYIPRAAANGDDNSTTSEYRRGMRAFRAIGWAQADHRLILETMEQALLLADLSDSASLKELQALFDEVAKKAPRFPPKILSGMLLPGMGTVVRFTSLEGRRRAAMLAIAVERYRHEHSGKLPDQLEELSPKFFAKTPVDPYDDQPIRFKKLTVGYVVYSIGKDFTDDGGKERPPSGPTKGFDDTFVVER